MTSIIYNCTLIFWFFMVNWVPSQINAAFTFESCYDWGSTFKGNCTVVSHDGAVGAESANTIWIQNGYLDYGQYWYGCPYKYNNCPAGFSFYGWMKFKAYPHNCSDHGVVTSTEIFNVHLLGSGHLAVYVWLPNGLEYYAESAQPIALDIWYPIVVQFQQGHSKNSWTLSVYAQNQLVAISFNGRSRTYFPPNSNLLFGGDGTGELSHNCSVQLDRTTFDVKVQDLATIYQILLNSYIRQAYCAGKYGIQPHSLTCYWVETVPLNWTQAYSSCSKQAHTSGFPYSRLAQFPTWNSTVWSQVTKRLAAYGNGTYGYNAWIGGGRQFQWLDSSMDPIQPTVVPEGVAAIKDGSSNSTCLQISTKTWPWQWSEGHCNTPQHYICEMSYDCLVKNPCKNFGVCQPINNGKNICTCWPGTSGQFCEIGTPIATCRNNCTNCTSTSLFKAPENCTNCLKRLQVSFNMLLQLEMKLKMQLIALSIDVEQAETWQLHVLDEFYNFTKTISPNFNIFDMPDCDSVWSSYAKLSVHEKIARKFMRKIQNISTNALTHELTDLWTNYNTSKTEFTNAKCFLDVLKNVQYSDGYSQFRSFFDDNHTADDLYLKNRFNNEAKNGQDAMGFFYFGDVAKTENGSPAPINNPNSTVTNQSTTTVHNVTSQNLTTPYPIINQTVNLTVTTPHAIFNQTGNVTATTPHSINNQTSNQTLTTLHTISNQTENLTLTTPHTISNQTGNLTLSTPHPISNQTVNQTLNQTLTTPHTITNQTGSLTLTTPHAASNQTGNLTLTTPHTIPAQNPPVQDLHNPTLNQNSTTKNMNQTVISQMIITTHQVINSTVHAPLLNQTHTTEATDEDAVDEEE